MRREKARGNNCLAIPAAPGLVRMRNLSCHWRTGESGSNLSTIRNNMAATKQIVNEWRRAHISDPRRKLPRN